MSDNKGFIQLLRNLEEGLKQYSPEEINKAMQEFLNKKGDKTQEIDFVINSVCLYYKISRHTLINSSGRGELQQARAITYCLLHLDVGLSIRHIGRKIFCKFPNSVHAGIKFYRSCDDNIKIEREFLQTYQSQKQLLLRFLESNNKN